MKIIDAPNNICFVYPQYLNSKRDNILTLGKQILKPYEKYPLEGFPDHALFSDNGGRCINGFQLIYIADGYGSFHDRGVMYEVTSGSIILIRPGVWHSYYPSQETGWTEYYVGFKGDLFARVVRDGFPQKGGLRKIKAKKEITNIFENMLNYAERDPEGLNFLLKSFLMLLISECVFADDSNGEENSQKTAMLSKARDFMEDNISERINLKSLSDDLGISYSTFKNIFKECTFCTPVEFLKQLRIRKSKFLLGTTSKPVKVIALECGFGTAEYFCNCFKNETGMTPIEYRDERHEDNQPFS